MPLNVNIHVAQTEIMRTLLFAPDASFSELCKKTGFTSDHFSFHIKKLVNQKMVSKTSTGHYTLTAKGKEYANQLDTDDRTIEKQPKTGVLLVLTRKNTRGETEYLFQKRLKQPFFGFYLFPTGKVRWGESFQETAQRELTEETNLNGSFALAGVTHKRDYTNKDKRLLEDKIFYVMHSTDFSGQLAEEFEGGENYWMTRKEFESQDKVMRGPNVVFKHLETKGLSFFEEEFYFDDSEY